MRAKWDPSILDLPRFDLLILPYGGPIAHSASPKGVDLDLEYFDGTTEIGDKTEWPVLFHHGKDRVMGNAPIGTAYAPRATREGGWVTVRWDPNDPRVALIRALGRRTPIYGSSSSEPGQSAKLGSRIVRWPMREVTLSPSPQNVLARIERSRT